MGKMIFSKGILAWTGSHFFTEPHPAQTGRAGGNIVRGRETDETGKGHKGEETVT